METSILHQIVKDSPRLAKTTREQYLRDLDSWIAFAGPSPTGWTRYRAQEFYMHLLGQMKPQSANGVMAGIAYASAWWARKEGRPELHFAIVEKAKSQGRATRRPLTHEQAIMLLATCQTRSPRDLRDRAMIVVGLETGMRRMSLAGMRLDTIALSAEGYPVAPVPIKGSGEDLYPVPLSDAVMIAIEPWRQWLRSQHKTKGPVFRPITKRIGPKGQIVYGVGDGALSQPAIYKTIAYRAAQAGLDGVYPHIFRHTFITWRAEAGMEPYQIAAITGHKIAGLPGVGALGGYINAARIGHDARSATPSWLIELLSRGTP